MTITHLHYHLRPGGITTVIRNIQKALPIQILANFGYDDHPSRRLRDKAETLLRQLPRAGILHTHNIGLGKNPALTYAVKLLAETGRVKIINQVHDFPEDHRPAQLRALRYCTGRRDDRFWNSICYYDLPNVIWATLTTHDAAQLAHRGIPSHKIHVLPNPVDTDFFAQHCRLDPRPILAAHYRQFDPRQPFLLSPMKVMERKNNAEAVALIRRLPGYQLIISLATAHPYCADLQRHIRRHRLPVFIGAGRLFENPLPLFRAAAAILTTSKQEGFGYTFIEGWLTGKLVLGRDIPEVTQDFRAAGMKLDHLYRDLDDQAVSKARAFLTKPPRALIAHNRRIILRKYSLAAYAARYRQLLRQL